MTPIKTKLDICVIILTFNEERNLIDCLSSINEFCSEIIIVDSGSTDNTLEIAKQFTDKVFFHSFENYAKQRNWALENLPISNEWILNLDADHRVTPELVDEFRNLFAKGIPKDVRGFLISRRTIFMGKWIKHGGHYPTYHSNFFRRGYGNCEDKLYDQHFLVKGNLMKLKGDIIDIITDSLTNFTIRHNNWSTLEAIYQLTSNKNTNVVTANFSGHAIQRRRALKSFYEKFPLFIRPFIYYFQRYILRMGFLDGKEGLIFHFLQGYWFRFLIDAKVYEIKYLAKNKNKTIQAVIKELYGISIED
jgi:glycosyltransferase involved in cell wall biosynthesis